MRALFNVIVACLCKCSLDKIDLFITYNIYMLHWEILQLSVSPTVLEISIAIWHTRHTGIIYCKYTILVCSNSHEQHH